MRMKPRRTARLLIAALIYATLASSAQAFLFGPKGDSTAEKKANIRKQREAMLAELYRLKPEMKQRLKKAGGYATFSQKDVNLFLLATANGYGVVVNNKARSETFMQMASLGGGVGLGVKDVRVIFVFNDARAMKQFVEQGWQFGGKADTAAKYKDTGVSAEQNVKASVDFRDGTVSAGGSTDARAAGGAASGKATLALAAGMEIYQFTESGVSLQATIAGTKYWKDSKLNP